MNTLSRYDALVIGGGPAGLTGALYLARFRRRVLVIDAGDGRARKIPCSHNYPGFIQGIRGSQLVEAMREHAQRYGVDYASGEVVALHHAPEGFSALWRPGEEPSTPVPSANTITPQQPINALPKLQTPTRSVQTKLVLLATGARDNDPQFAQLHEAIRSGAIRYCPVCDAYEVIGRRIGIVTDNNAGLREALYLRTYTDQITVFIDTAHRRDNTDSTLLQQAREVGIEVVESRIDALQLETEQRIAVQHSGKQDRYDTLYAAFGVQVRGELADQLGARRHSDRYLWTDEHQQTSVAGLYAAGDVSHGLNQIAVATGNAAIAASAMHRRLGTADQVLMQGAGWIESGATVGRE